MGFCNPEMHKRATLRLLNFSPIFYNFAVLFTAHINIFQQRLKHIDHFLWFCVWGGWGVCVCVGFLASIRDMFCFLPSKLGTHCQTGISPISSKGCREYNLGYRVWCIKTPHSAIGGNVASCPVKSLNCMIIYRSTGVIRGQPDVPFAWCVNMCKTVLSPIEAINRWGVLFC